jgi:TetR/AcrR family transcriptional regulator, transcriptional repressor for nem operon
MLVSNVNVDTRVIDSSGASMVGVRQFDETALLNTAMNVFWRKGLHATSMLDLAEATGVQRGSLYNAFGSKEAMFLLAFDIYAATFLSAAREALANPDAKKALQAFFKVAINNMIAGSPARGCLTTKTATENNQHEPRIQDKVRRLLADLEETIRTSLTASSASRTLTLSPNQAAALIVTFTRGLAVMERVHQDPKRLHDNAASLIKVLISS